MLHKKPFFLIFLIFFLFLGACNHLNKSCLEINWYEVGRQDSTRGRKWEDTFSERKQICSFKKDSHHERSYKNGFDVGLREYCSFKTGYIYGLSKTEEQAKVCPEDLKKKFSNGYEAGTYMTKIQTLQNELQKQIGHLEEKITNYESDKSLTMNESQSQSQSKNQSQSK